MLNPDQFGPLAHEPGVRSYDVDFVTDHESLKAGRVKDGTHRVTVHAKNDTEGALIAAQMVGATQGMPTATRIVL